MIITWFIYIVYLWNNRKHVLHFNFLDHHTSFMCNDNNRGGVRLGLPVHGISYPEMDSTKTFVAEQHIFHNALTFLMLIDI